MATELRIRGDAAAPEEGPTPEPGLAPVALLVARPDGRILAAGGAWRRLTGHDSRTACTQRLQDLVTDGSRLFLETHCMPVLASGKPVEEAMIDVVDADGERLPMLLYGSPDEATGNLQIALVPAHRRRAYESEMRRMRERERRNNDLQILVARLSKQALGGLGLAELGKLAADTLHDLLPADLVTVIELSVDGPALIASSIDLPAVAEGQLPTLVDAEAAHAVTRLARRPAIAEVGRPLGLALAVAQSETQTFTSLRVPVGAPRQPEALISVFRHGSTRNTSFEIGAIQAVAQTLWTALTRFRELEAATYRAEHDPLTGLANRRRLLARLDAAIHATRAGAPRPALLFLDRDDFKAINDTHGHDAGDRLLQEVAERLRGAVRGHDTVARIGGDEFAILCPELGDAGPARAVAQRVELSLARPFAAASGALGEVTASIGIAVPDPTSSPTEALAEADVAMYRNKALRRGASGGRAGAGATR